MRDLEALQATFKTARSRVDGDLRQALQQRIDAPVGQPPSLQPEVEAAFLSLMGHNDHAWDRAHEIGADMVHLWCAQARPELAVRALLLNYDYADGGNKATADYRGFFPYVGTWRAVRGYLASASPEDYSQALQAAAETMQHGPLNLRRMLAVAFSEETEFVHGVVRQALQEKPSFFNLGMLASVRDGELFEQLCQAVASYLGSDFIGVNLLDFLPTALARLQDAALAGLLCLARAASKAGDKRALADLLSQLDHPDVKAWFEQNKKDKVVAPAALAYLERFQPAAPTSAPSQAGEAPSDTLPELLKNPPWTRPAPAKKGVAAVKLEMADFPETVHLSAELRDALLKRNEVCTPQQFRKWTQGFPRDAPYLRFAERLCNLCDRDWAIRAWNETDSDFWNIYSFRSEWDQTAERLLATFGPAVVPGLLKIAPMAPDHTYSALATVESARLAPLFADLRATSKKFRGLAQKWLKAYPRAAAVGLIPGAVKGSKAQATALRWLAAHGHTTELEEAASSYGVLSQVSALLEYDPLCEIPSKLPARPAWWKAERYAAPLLKSGGALPKEALDHIGTMLAISKLDEPYAGLEVVKEVCQPRSLEDFAWSVYQSWLHAGGPAKEDWGLLVLGYEHGFVARGTGAVVQRLAAARAPLELTRYPLEPVGGALYTCAFTALAARQ